MKFLKSLFYIQKPSVRFFKYLLSYILLVVLLLLIIGSVVYSSIISTLQNDVEANSIAELSQTRDAVDARVVEMERVAMQIASDFKLKDIIAGGEGYDVYQAVRDISRYRSSNLFIYDIAIYYTKNDGRIFTSNGPYDIDLFFDSAFNYQNWGKSGFLMTVENIRSPIIRPLEAVRLYHTDNTEFATYLYPLPNIGVKPNGVVLFLIKNDALEGMIKNVLKNYSGSVYILDENGQPIASSTSGMEGSRKQELLEAIHANMSTKTVSTVTIGKENYSIIKLSSAYNHWSYITVIPSQQLMQKVHSIRYVFNFTSIAVFLLGIAIAFAFAARNYIPLQKMVDVIKGQLLLKTSVEKTDEIAFISNVIGQVTEENKGLTTKLKSKASLMKEQLLLYLLKGKYANQDKIYDLASMAGIKFDKPYFMTLLFLVDRYNAFKSENSRSMQELLKFSIINVIEELSQEIGCGYGLDLIDERGIVLVLNINAGFEEDAFISKLATVAKDLYKENFGYTLTVGIGNIYADILMLHQSFVEATRAAYFRFIKGEDQIIFYKNLQSVEGNKFHYPAEQEAKLVMAIQQGNGKEIQNIIRGIVENFIKQSVSLETAQSVCMGVINAVFRTIEGMDIDTSGKFSEDIEQLLSQQFETVEALELRVGLFCEKVCEYIANQKESKNFRLREELIAYAKEHYSDNSISLEVIADRFNLSPSYITRFFKDQTGCSLMSYIDSLRMEKALDLLKRTNYTIKEIIKSIGYMDETNFIRKFKKTKGITPMQYRNIAKGSS